MVKYYEISLEVEKAYDKKEFLELLNFLKGEFDILKFKIEEVEYKKVKTLLISGTGKKDGKKKG